MSLEGQQLGEFEIIERIGRGGMGAVYKARQTSLKRTVALKTLQSALAEDEDYIARFRQEAVAAAGLHHSNLVQVYSAGENDGLHWFAMEYVEGESARERLKRKGRLDPLEAIAIAIHVATALEYGWRKAALIHRDIKPDNIFLSGDGEVKLGDLGLAKSAGQTQGLTMAGSSMGTPHYMSPEQVEGMRDVDLRADIYSLGCTLFHLLCGQPPYVGNSSAAVMMKHLSAPVPDLRSAWPECPAELAAAVAKMMQKRPEDRPQSYEEVNADLRRAYDLWSGSSVPSVIAVTQKPAAGEKKRGVPVMAWLGGGVALLAAIAALVYFAPWKKAGQESPSTAASLTTARVSPSTEPWEDVLRDPAKLGLAGGAERTPEGLRIPEAGSAMRHLGQGPLRDGAVRMRATFGAAVPQLHARAAQGVGLYQLSTIGEKAIELDRYDSLTRQSTHLREFPLREPLQAGQDYELELRVVGQTLTAKFNGEVLGTVGDGALLEGPFGVGVSAHNAASALVKALEVLDLDWPVDSNATLPKATKEKPFVNTLGMKFVPVPILGGPTGGHRVLFSVWDTRVQDYEVFVKETKREWPKADFPQGPTHPAVMVSWEDAQLFCQWLTVRDQAAGLLPLGWRYRLPSDHEWSCAVELAGEDAAKLPAEKNNKIGDAFPWGTPWPPPKGAGNYAGEELRPAQAAGKYTNIKELITGYDDGFVNTSPVGSFAANRFGLFDMGGNVWQWCEDRFDKDQKENVLRGASWNYNSRGSLLSSSRNHYAPGTRFDNYGFRCVLASASTAPATYEESDQIRVNPSKSDLSSPPAAASSTAAAVTNATKAAPFVNSLDMKFVPVPIVSGPTAGQRVLFSVWDTRVQDYATYAGAKKADDFWTKQAKDGVPAGRELNHPVVSVSWEDAQGFCQWLTEKETAEGSLPKGMKYRLPTDEEWSWAVGLPPELGATPAEKNGKNSVDFPWGKDYPPRQKVGNYADEAFHAKFPPKEDAKDDWNKNRWIEGYTDGYATTSPVGSFLANAYGLYDMGGNVSQWCEDWFDASHKDRVLRGASWGSYGRSFLLSSYRGHRVPGVRNSHYGFRCVVGVSAR
jgi:serine/threonine protein kinase/formylglycine-generating enzyme required for sulfatase activity